MKVLSRKLILPTVVTVGLFLFCSLWIMYGFIDVFNIHHKSHIHLSSSFADIVEAAIIAEYRTADGPDINKIRDLLTLFVRITPVYKVALKDSQDHVLITAGEEKGIKRKLRKNRFYKVERVFKTAENKDVFLIIIFDLESFTQEYQISLNFLSTLFGVVCIVVLMFYLLWSTLVKLRDLNNRLISERQRSVYAEELSLAAAGLAHETKNPLGIIRGLAQSIADDSTNSEKTRNMAREIMEETDVTTARLGDFLSYAKFRSPELDELDAVEYIGRIADLLRDDMKNAGVALLTDIDDVKIFADKDMLSQILVNLLTNSLRYCRSGGVVKIELKKKRGSTAELSVSDDGEGIPEDILPNIFKPYFTNSASGYGIGLAIVKRIVEQSGWTIKVNSKLGKGTTVIISNIRIV
jgi:signal transduction histidine kinase